MTGQTTESGVAVCCAYRSRRQRDRRIHPEDHDGSAWREDPGRAVHGHGRLEGGAGQVPTKPAGRSWPNVTPPTMTSTIAAVAPAVCRITPPRPTPMTAMRLTATAPKKIAVSTPGWPRVTWRCLPAKIRWPISKATTIGDQRHREGECRHYGCLARKHESPRRHGGEGRADHARGILGGHRP